MGTQQSSRSQAPRKQASEKQTNTGLDFIFKRPIFWRPSYIAQSAWLEHIPFAFWLIDTLQPRKIVELGTHYGSSYFSFCQAVTKLDLETQCYAVDTWGGDEHAGQYGEEVYRQVSEHNQQHYSDFSTLVRSTFDQALEHFPQGSIDLLHIDGLHTLEAVRHDFESWLPKLSNKAVVIMHDTNVRERGFGVFQLMDELKQQYPHFEFAHGHGLGVIGVGSEQSSEMLSLYALSGNPSATRQVQEVFSRLGKACGYSWENSEIKRQMVALQANQQAQTQDVMEQQALERGRLAEKITAQHHTIKALEEKLAQHTDQSAELNLQKQQVSALTAELEKSNQHASELQTALTLCEQQRDESLAGQQNLEALLTKTREQLTQAVSERDLIAQEKQTLLEQQTEAQEQLSALQQQLHEQTLHLNEETQRAAQLNLALNKNNVVLAEYSKQLSALQHKIDEDNAELATAYQKIDELSQALAKKSHEASHLQHEQQVLAETHRQLQIQCESLTIQLNICTDEITTLNQTIDQKSVDLEQTRNQLANVQEELSKQEKKLNERFTEIAMLTGWLEESEQTLASAASEQQKIKEELKTYQQTWRNKQLEYQAEQTESQQKLDELKQALRDRFTEIATLTVWLEEREQLLEKSANESRQAAMEYHAHQQAWRNEHQHLTEKAAQQQADLNNRINELVKLNEGLEANITERFLELAMMTKLDKQQSK